jgi:hypothetical protein
MRKTQVENEYRGAFRQIATANAASFLWASIQSDLFSSGALPHNNAPMLRLKEPFAISLDSTDVIFQHRYKQTVGLSDLFVYPDMISIRGEPNQKLNSSMLSDLGGLPTSTLVLGESQTGTTSLAKSLFSAYFRSGAIPILLLGGDMKSSRFSEIIDRAFNRQYEGMALNAALQSGRPFVLVVDDYQKITINKTAQLELLQYIDRTFGKVVIIGNHEVFSTDTKFADFSEYRCYELLPFGHARRHELISRWVRLGQEDTLSDADFLQRLDVCDQHVNSIILRNIVPPKPFYICSIMQYFEASTPSDYHLTSYGHCYQSLIIQAFAKAKILPKDIDKYVNYLTELAFFLYTIKHEVISKEELARFAASYSAKYLIESHADVLNGLVRCGLLRRDEDGGVYFGYKYTFYFYCAKYISDNYAKKEMQELVQRLCEHVWLEENANIIIFMTHHSKDQRMIDEIMLHTMLRFSNTRESMLLPSETGHFLEYEKMIPALVIEERNILEERARQARARDDVEAEFHKPMDGKRTTVVGSGKQEGCGELEEDKQPATADEEKVKHYYQEFHSSLRSIEIVGANGPKPVWLI